MLTTKKFLIFASTNNDKYLACRLVSFSADVMSIEHPIIHPIFTPASPSSRLPYKKSLLG